MNTVTPYDTTVRSIYLDDFYVRSWTRPSLSPVICEEFSLFNNENDNLEIMDIIKEKSMQNGLFQFINILIALEI